MGGLQVTAPYPVAAPTSNAVVSARVGVDTVTVITSLVTRYARTDIVALNAITARRRCAIVSASIQVVVVAIITVFYPATNDPIATASERTLGGASIIIAGVAVVAGFITLLTFNPINAPVPITANRCLAGVRAAVALVLIAIIADLTGVYDVVPAALDPATA